MKLLHLLFHKAWFLFRILLGSGEGRTLCVYLRQCRHCHLLSVPSREQTSGRKWDCSGLDHMVRRCFDLKLYSNVPGSMGYPRWWQQFCCFFSQFDRFKIIKPVGILLFIECASRLFNGESRQRSWNLRECCTESTKTGQSSVGFRASWRWRTGISQKRHHNSQYSELICWYQIRITMGHVMCEALMMQQNILHPVVMKCSTHDSSIESLRLRLAKVI